MKLLLLLTAITSVVGFLPKGAVRQTTPMEMVSFGFGGPESGFATPDPTRKVALPKPGDKNNVLIDPDLKFPAAIGAYSAGALMMYPSAIGVYSAAFHAFLACFLWSQANRVRLIMGKDSFELYNLSNDGQYLKEKPSNYVAGTVNRWNYKDVIDYGFFPSREYPFIVYFKETATPKEQWGGFGWWGMFASTFDPTRTKLDGQPHFMPALFDTEQFIKQMESHGVKCRSKVNNYNMWF